MISDSVMRNVIDRVDDLNAKIFRVGYQGSVADQRPILSDKSRRVFLLGFDAGKAHNALAADSNRVFAAGHRLSREFESGDAAWRMHRRLIRAGRFW